MINLKLSKQLCLTGLILFSFYTNLLSQPGIFWDKVYGGTDGNEDIYNMILLDDGTYVIVGYTSSTDSDATGNHGGWADAFVLKINPKTGEIIWKKTFGGDGYDLGLDIMQLKDGSLLMMGKTNSNNNGDVHNQHGGDDIWLVKLDLLTGDTLWTNCYGGPGIEIPYDFIQHTDGTIYVNGYTSASGGDVTSFKGGGGDTWVIKLNEQTGQIIWARTYGGTLIEYGHSIMETLDGQVVLAIETYSNNTGDVAGGGFHFDGISFWPDVWVVKVDTLDGSILWHRCVGGDANEGLGVIGVNTIDSNIIFVCNSTSANGDVHHAHGSFDYFIFSMSLSTGDTNWCRTYGGSDADHYSNIIYSEQDNTLIALGLTVSIDGDIHQNHGSADIWAIKINASTGDTIWTRAYGGKGYDYLSLSPDKSHLRQTCDNGFVFIGSTHTDTIDGDKTEVTPIGMGLQPASWMVRIDENGTILWDKTICANGPWGEHSRAILANDDGSYGIAIYTSNDSGGYKTAPELGNGDWWIIQLDYDREESGFDFLHDVFPCSDSVLFTINDADSVKQPSILYYWDWDDGIRIDSSLNSSIIHTFDVVQDYSVQLIKQIDCMHDTITKIITLSDLISLNIADDTLFCEQDFININTGYDSLIHLWSTNDTASAINVDQEGVYWVTLIKDSTCQMTDSFTIYLVMDSTNIEFNDTTINKGDSIRYEIIGNGNIKWISNQVEIICDTCSTITVYPSVNPSQISIEYQIGNNCIVNKTINIYIVSTKEIFLSNVINRSSINNTFGLGGQLLDAENYYLEIFDRRGAKVFATDNIQENWQGTSFENKPLPEDVYGYHILFKIDERKYEYKGNVFILD